MNGVFQKMQEDQARTQPAPIDLSIDLVVPESNLFFLSLDELRKLDQRMFEQTQRESYALSQLCPRSIKPGKHSFCSPPDSATNATLFRLAAQLEKAQPWDKRRPQL